VDGIQPNVSGRKKKRERNRELRQFGLLDEMLSTAEMARELERSEVTLKRWRAQRVGPPWIRRGRLVLYPLGKAREWLRKGEITPVGEI
jgi:hypothetical protein